MSAATKLDGLCMELLEASSDPRVLAVATRLLAVAAQLHQQEAAVVPAHLREPEPVLPPGVAALWKDGRWIERRKGRRP